MRKVLPIAAATVAGLLALTACSGNVGAGSGDASSNSTSTGSGAQADTITFGMPQAPAGYNNQSVDGNSIYNQWVDNATQSGFTYIDPDAKLVPNKDFGSYTKTSDDPLTIEYTVNDKAVWSDGVPIDCVDFVGYWAAMSGKLISGTDDDGNPKNIFNAASTNGFSEMQQPKCAAGDKKFTVVFDKPYADWESLFTQQLPAHIWAEQGGIDTKADKGADLIAKITAAAGGDATALAALQKGADFWGSGWQYPENVTSFLDLKLIPSSGPYTYVSGVNGVITVKKSDSWWGTAPKTDTLVYKVIAAAEMAQALENGEIDGFQPATTTQDMVSTVNGLKDKGVESIVGPAMSFTHIDLAQGAGQVFENPKVREAFLKCVPRQGIVDALAKPVNPDAVILNLREYMPFQPEYKEVLAGAPSASKYDTQDIDGAKQLLADAGVTTPLTVRIMRPTSEQNPIRERIVQLVKASCDQAGFSIVDNPQNEWPKKLTNAGVDWDAVIFGWSASGMVAAGQSIYVTGGDQNFGGYSDAKVDDLWSQIVVSTDPAKVIELKTQLEEQLAANPYNVLLFADTNLTAITNKLHGVVANPTQYGPTWNISTWTKDA